MSHLAEDVREEAARCADEMAKHARGERGPLGEPSGPSWLVDGKFSAVADELAAEVAEVAFEALMGLGKRFTPALCWEVASQLLRGGWRRGCQIDLMEIGKGEPS